MKSSSRSPLLCGLVAAATLHFSVLIAQAQTLPAATVAKLRAVLDEPALADAHIGVCVRELGAALDNQSFPAVGTEQVVLFEQDADKRFLPASNMKLFTAAVALQALGEERRFSTRVVQSAARPGALYLIAGGDPSLGLDDLKQLARDVRAQGIRKVKGVYVDNSMFVADSFGGRYPDGWTLDDALWYYGMEVSAIALERNQVDVTVTGTSDGKPATVGVSPNLPGFVPGRDIVASVATKAGGQGSVQFDRGDATSAIGPKLFVRGTVAPNQKVTEGVAVSNVPQVAALAFARALREAGVKVKGTVGVETNFDPNAKTVAHHDSAPLGTLLQRFLKKSDNLYGEMLLRDVGVLAAPAVFSGTNGNTAGESVSNGVSSTGAAAQGHVRLLQWLQSASVPTAGLRLSDGSGLSRYNLLTPRAIVELLRAVNSLPGSRAFYEALPIAGVDGTLANRMKGTVAANNVRAKTGTFSIASALSGYVTTRGGKRLAVSVLTNFVRNGDDARRLQNSIFTTLAEADFGSTGAVVAQRLP